MGNRIQSIASMVFALAFVALLAILNTNILGIGQSVNKQLDNTHIAIQESTLNDFNDTLVTGQTVINTIKNRDKLYDYELQIIVKTANGGDTTYGPDGEDSYDSNQISVSDADYINPVKSFKANIEYDNGTDDGNNIVTGIVFEET